MEYVNYNPYLYSKDEIVFSANKCAVENCLQIISITIIDDFQMEVYL